MSRRWYDANDPRVLLVGLAIIAVLLGAFGFAAWLSEQPEVRDHFSIHVGADAPCEVEVYQAACDYWERRGLPGCTASPFAGVVRATTWTGPQRGAHGEGVGALRDQVAVREDQCDTCTPVHEVGHAGGQVDSIGDGPMCGDPDVCTVTCRGWR